MHRLKIVSMVLLTIVVISGCERFKLDRQMEELCRKDGGVKVYETVTLPPDEYARLFTSATSKNGDRYYGPEYRYVQHRAVIAGKDADPEKGQGRLSRWSEEIYRRLDGKLLGESVFYIRAGGDGFTFGFHPSSNVCPRPRAGLGTSVFLKGE